MVAGVALRRLAGSGSKRPPTAGQAGARGSKRAARCHATGGGATSTHVQELVQGLQGAFGAAASPDDAEAMTAYVKGRFKFFGIKAPRRRELAAGVVQPWRAKYNLLKGSEETEKVLRELLEQMYACEEREMHYTAAELCAEHLASCKDGWTDAERAATMLEVLRYGVVNRSWWDTVDIFACGAAAKALAKEPPRSKRAQPLEQRMEAWTTDRDFWLRRCSILSQLKRKKNTDTVALERCIQLNIDHGEFFVRKAIGWVLREYAKTDRRWVECFVTEHRGRLSALSLREATKHMPELRQ